MPRLLQRCLLLAMLVVASCLSGAARAETPKKVDTAHQLCQSDMDCVIVDTSSCPCLCSAKGMIALNRIYADQYKQPDHCTSDEVDICAERGMCGQIKVAKCEQGRCVARMPY